MNSKKFFLVGLLFFVLLLLAIAFLATAWLAHIDFSVEKSEAINESTPTQSQSSASQLYEDHCDIQNCLFSYQQGVSQLLGITTISGYYQKNIRNYAIGPNPTPNLQECDEFVITTAKDEFMIDVDFMINYGNSNNRKLENGKFAISISSKNGFLSTDEQSRLYNSNPNNLINISIFIPNDQTVSPLMYCTTLYDIIRVWPNTDE